MEQNFIEHLYELRKRLILITVGFIVVFIGLFYFANTLYQLISIPVEKFLPATTKLIATDITSPFLAPLKLTAAVAFLVSFPNTIYQALKFISPGLHKNERKLVIYIVTSSFILFLAGIAFCYFLVLPAIFHFIGNFKATQITMMTDINSYLSFVCSLFMVFGLSFEMPVVTFLLIYLGVLKLSTARSIRPYMFVGCFIIAAIITPPDVLSQIMLALPLYILYEIGLLFSRVKIAPTTDKENIPIQSSIQILEKEIIK